LELDVLVQINLRRVFLCFFNFLVKFGERSFRMCQPRMDWVIFCLDNARELWQRWFAFKFRMTLGKSIVDAEYVPELDD